MIVISFVSSCEIFEGPIDLLRLDALPHGSSCQVLRSLLLKAQCFTEKKQSGARLKADGGATTAGGDVCLQSGDFGQFLMINSIPPLTPCKNLLQ